MKRLIHLFSASVISLLLTQCASVRPQGSSDQEKRDFIDDEAARIVATLKKSTPAAGKDLESSAGYAAFRYSSGKLPIILGGLGGGAGYGVCVDGDGRTYMKVQKANWGLGVGVRENSVVFVFSDPEVMEKFKQGKWDAGAAAEATVKKDEVGAGIGGVASIGKGYKVYTLTDAGLSYGVTYQTRRFSPIQSLNRQ